MVVDLLPSLQTIRQASSAQAVVDSVGMVLSKLSEAERAELPWGLMPEVVKEPGDVALWALQLRAKGNPGNVGPVYGRICRVFIEAADRLAMLGAL